MLNVVNDYGLETKTYVLIVKWLKLECILMVKYERKRTYRKFRKNTKTIDRNSDRTH